MGSIVKPTGADVDVIIIGAGLSGIDVAYRVQTELPKYSYTVLETRSVIGGTWDLFRYPGIRSDSDLHTFGYPWRPWTDERAIAVDGEKIRKYIEESAEEYGIDRKIRFHHKLVSADWSSAEQRWTLSVEADGEKTTFHARFVIFSTGYYDYDEPMKVSIPGIENFKGKVIHPQFWPEDYDYSGKKIIVIGSGATAVTLFPVLAEKAGKVTMLQRSPSYVVSLPTYEPIDNFIRRVLPIWLALKILRWKNIIHSEFIYQYCRAFPNSAKKSLRAEITPLLPKGYPIDPHFTPSYNPWTQRVCVCPDEQFFKALHKDNADIVTAHIKTMTENSIITEDGQSLEADVIITATGLKLQAAGGVPMSIDGKPFTVARKYMWRATMVQGLPNVGIILGYANASWTLGADPSSQMICRLLKLMEKRRLASAVPQVKDSAPMKDGVFFDLDSTYMKTAQADIPKTGDKAPWLPRSNYVVDRWNALHADLTNGLQFEKFSTT